MFNIKLKDIFLIPNLISLSRIILMGPVGILLLKNGIYNKVLLIVLGIIILSTDFLDGMLARKLHQESELGKILDPLADKLCFIIGAILFVLIKKFPLWILIYIILRDVFVFLGGWYLSSRTKTVVQSNIWGKISTVMLSLSFLSILIFDINFIASLLLLLLGLFFFTYSTINYFYFDFIPTKNFNKKKKQSNIIFAIFIVIFIVYIFLGIKGIVFLPTPFDNLINIF